jgi:2-dehydro-3-deoxyphosphogluconate aldolase/(4S)-4-hydroxy-2-oxoglutarate aldolase
MDSITQAFSKLRVIPVVVLERSADARPLGQALQAGGLPCAEITFRTDAAEAAIQALTQDAEMLVGAGTVVRVEQVDRAIAAGARFIVTPGFSRAVVEHCLDRGIAVYPGVATPTEMQMALEMDVTTVKFFPAEAAGGVHSLAAMSAPYAMMRFIPTGGITLRNLSDYLHVKSVVAVGGSWLVAPDLIAHGSFDEITRRTAQAVDVARTAT